MRERRTISQAASVKQAAGGRRKRRWLRCDRGFKSLQMELLGRNSKRDNVTRLEAVLAGHGRDRLPARTTR